jgi:hypothetical protein
MESWVGMKNLVYKRGIELAGSIALYKHVTHYDPRSGFLSVLQPDNPHRECSLYPPPKDVLSSSVG